MYTVTCRAPVNIAVVKYWGKRNEKLILPINDSISATLCMDQLCATTTVSTSNDFLENKLLLNSIEMPFETNNRLMACWNDLKALAKQKGTKVPLEWKIHISSENNFPTAAGLASSAAGYACLVYTIACLYEIQNEEISSIARKGSGSACRSLYGGFVKWKMGELDSGKDSLAVQLFPSVHWPEMRVLILVVNDTKKKTSSTQGMLDSVNTSDLLKFRAQKCVPERIESMNKAIKEKDFKKFGELTMKDSNQFHAICMDTFPPCIYLNEISHSIINFVHDYNTKFGETKIAYTFDAGPNACIFVLEKDVESVLAAINVAFPNKRFPDNSYIKGLQVQISEKNLKGFKGECTKENALKYIIHTKLGEGPEVLKNSVGSDAI